jgi:hypothetical protein
MNERPKRLVLNTDIGKEVITYVLQVYFSFGNKEGETKYKIWSYAESTMSNNLDDVKESLEDYIKDGYEARIVKITTKAEVME